MSELMPPDLVLPVDKPSGPTSHDVVARARRALGTRRVGHTGTLDPFASGLLLVCVGRATRIAEYLTALDKTYEATVCLGAVTDSLDREGAVVERHAGWEGLGWDGVVAALGRFEGEIHQVPPQFSAKKVGGEAMHRKARRGERVVLEPRLVRIHELALLGMALPLLYVRVHCSSGTYVRALARDLGEALEVGGHLTELRRTAVGAVEVERAVPAGALGDPARVGAAALSPLDALAHLPALEVVEEQARRLGQGQAIELDDAPRLSAPPMRGSGGDATTAGRSVDDAPSTGPRPVRVVYGGELLAIAEAGGGRLRPKKVFHG